jgi:hypothetical protein
VTPLLAKHPEHIEPRLLRAWALWHRDKKPTSPDRPLVVSELKALRASTRTVGALFLLSWLFLAVDEPDEALSATEAAISLTPGSARLRYLRAKVFHALGRDGDAVREMDLAIGLAPHGWDTRRLREELAEYQRGVRR